MPGAQLQLSRSAQGAHEGVVVVARVVAGATVVVGAATHTQLRQPLLSVTHVWMSSLRKHAQGWAAGQVEAAEVARTVVGAAVEARAVEGAGWHWHDEGQPLASVEYTVTSLVEQPHSGSAPQRAVVARAVVGAAVVARAVVAAAVEAPAVAARVVAGAAVVAATVGAELSAWQKQKGQPLSSNAVWAEEPSLQRQAANVGHCARGAAVVAARVVGAAVAAAVVARAVVGAAVVAAAVVAARVVGAGVVTTLTASQ